MKIWDMEDLRQKSEDVPEDDKPAVEDFISQLGEEMAKKKNNGDSKFDNLKEKCPLGSPAPKMVQCTVNGKECAEENCGFWYWLSAWE